MAKEVFIGSDTLRSLLECPVCLDTPRSKPIFPCAENGHLICGSCHPKLVSSNESCPQCKGLLGNGGSRSILLEKMLELLPHKCEFSQTGCEVELTNEDLAAHEKLCLHRVVKCPLGGTCTCKSRVSLKKMLDHISNDHNVDDYIDMGEVNEFEKAYDVEEADFEESSKIIGWQTAKMRFNNEVFFVKIYRRPDGIWTILVAMLETGHSSLKDYVCTVGIFRKSEEGNEIEMIFKGPPTNLDVNGETVFQTCSGLIFTDAAAKKCLINESIAYEVMIEKK